MVELAPHLVLEVVAVVVLCVPHEERGRVRRVRVRAARRVALERLRGIQGVGGVFNRLP